MNILYLGKFFPQTMLKTIKADSKGKIGFSNHNFEMSILNGLCQQDGICLRCITLPGVFSYPQNNRNFFTKSESYDFRNTHITSVGFCNLKGVKEKWSTVNCAKLIMGEISKFQEGAINVLVNTPDSRLLDALEIVRRKSKRHITQTVIIPDIPSMVTSMDKQNFIKKILLGRRDKKSMEMTSESNGLVLLTEAMMDFVSKPIKHIVMEGIVDAGTMDKKGVEAVADKKVILYTGTLRKIFGVQNLVKAFQLIKDKDVELWICGAGDSKEFIENAANTDSRIKFYGLVESSMALEMQHKATILVNPRTSDGEYTKYSFPSKTMEYLLAGKSTVVNRLSGIPEEYFNYAYTPKDESVEALAECLANVLHLSEEERAVRANAGRQFILEKKNSKVQVERVIKMIKSYE